MHANLHALGAIALWASLAALGVTLQHVPPFLLTGLALLIGSVPAWPALPGLLRQGKLPISTLALGIYGLFGFHFLLFVSLRLAPPVQANLINYLWPLLIVVMAPLFLHELTLKPLHLVAAAMGFAGAALAILGSADVSADGGRWHWGYLLALASAFVWASYSLLTRRVAAFPTSAIGLFGLVSGLLSLLCHLVLESTAPSFSALAPRDWWLLTLLGLGPLGAAFFLWDAALKRGDARQIGVLSYLTPLGSTALLVLVSGQPWRWSIAAAAVLIIGAALISTRAR
jgi:drug/metabolite transporter (DMT)-like permease